MQKFPGVHGVSLLLERGQKKPMSQPLQSFCEVDKSFGFQLPPGQLLNDGEPEGHQLPGGQDRHAAAEVEPVCVLYVPAAHGVVAFAPAPDQEPEGVVIHDVNAVWPGLEL